MEESDLVRRVEALQEAVAALEKRNSDLALKAQIVSNQLFGKVGLDRFFAEPEFWENTYDSGQADCSRRCIEELQAAYAACDKQHPEGSEERANCHATALADSVICHKRCAEAFPPPIS
jgi:hypothetical protein